MKDPVEEYVTLRLNSETLLPNDIPYRSLSIALNIVNLSYHTRPVL